MNIQNKENTIKKENEKQIKNYLFNYDLYYMLLNDIKTICNKNNIQILKIYENDKNIIIKFKENKILNEFLKILRNFILNYYNFNEDEIYIYNKNKLSIDNIKELIYYN